MKTTGIESRFAGLEGSQLRCLECSGLCGLSGLSGLSGRGERLTEKWSPEGIKNRQNWYLSLFYSRNLSIHS